MFFWSISTYISLHASSYRSQIWHNNGILLILKCNVYAIHITINNETSTQTTNNKALRIFPSAYIFSYAIYNFKVHYIPTDMKFVLFISITVIP